MSAVDRGTAHAEAGLFPGVWLVLEDGCHQRRAPARAVRGEHQVELVLHPHQLGDAGPGQHSWQHADKHCKLASRENGTGTTERMHSCKTIMGQQWDSHWDSAAICCVAQTLLKRCWAPPTVLTCTRVADKTNKVASLD